MRPVLDIAGRLVGAGHPAYVIAEIGSNHDGSLDRAVALIDAAATAGADAVKFQSFTAATLAARSATRLYDFFSANELDTTWLPALAAAAARGGVHFLSTPFHDGAVDELVAVGSPALKIASGDLTNHPLLRTASATGLPLIVSSGAAKLEDVKRSVDVLERAGCEQLAVLHCVSAYPPAFDEVNIRAMVTIGGATGLPVGISDHTPGATVPVAAVALGACIVEKHITDDRGRSGPDHAYALTVDEFGAMVRAVHDTEAALGHGRKEPAASDEAERYWAWRGLYARADLPAGHVLSVADLIPLRPREGVGADEVDLVVGARLTQPVESGAALTWGAVDH